MTKTVDELMRLADEYAIHLLDTAKGADNVLETGVARLALRSALEEVVANAARFAYLKEHEVDWLPPKWNGNPKGRHDMIFYSDIRDLGEAIDAAMQQAPEQEG